nr:SpoIIE family protein phosphatase [Bacteroidota bacterium]
MKSRNSLAFRLSLTILSVVLLIFVAIVFYNYAVSKKFLIEDAKKDTEAAVRLIISQIEDALNTLENPVGLLSEFTANNDPDSEMINQLLTLLAARNQAIFCNFVKIVNHGESNKETIIHYLQKHDSSHKITEYRDQMINSWLKKDSPKEIPFWTEPYHDKQANERSIAYIVPTNIRTAGTITKSIYAGIIINLNWLQELIGDKKSNTSEYSFIITREGYPVSKPGSEFTYQDNIFDISKKLNNPDMIELGKQMMSGASSSMEVRGLQKYKSVVYFAPVPSTNWSVAFIFPKFELFKNLYFTTLKLGIAGIIGFLLILATTLYILKRMISPLRKLSDAARLIGHGNLDAEMPVINTRDEVYILKDSLETMQKELRTYIKNLVQSEKYKERTESELKVAQHIQMGYLKQDFTGFSKDKPFEIAAAIKPARHVGGDFYDYFMLDGQTLCFAIGDVAGKGVPAALFMAVALTLVRSADLSPKSLADAVGKINNHLCKQNESAVFTTFCIGLLNVYNGQMVFCNAGHNYPYLIKDNELFELHSAHGSALGAMENVKYKTGTMLLTPENMLVLYTDGITDAENRKSEFFGKQRLEDILRTGSDHTAAEMIKRINTGIKKFTSGQDQFDDLTLLAIKLK